MRPAANLVAARTSVMLSSSRIAGTWATHGPRRGGFTMIELLAVIVVIAIIAAVAIPNFVNSTGAAQEATVKADVQGGVQAALSYYQKTSNTFVGITPALANWTASSGNTPKYANVAADSVDVQSSNATANRRCYRRLSFKTANSLLICSTGVY